MKKNDIKLCTENVTDFDTKLKSLKTKYYELNSLTKKLLDLKSEIKTESYGIIGDLDNNTNLKGLYINNNLDYLFESVKLSVKSDSVKLNNTSNCLSENDYLISPEIHKLLTDGFNGKIDRKISIQEPGIYLVSLGSIMFKSEKTYIYKYNKYSYIFDKLLYYYVSKGSCSINTLGNNLLCSDYLYVVDNSNLNKQDVVYLFNDLTYGFNISNIETYPKNLIDILKILLKGRPIILNKDNVCEFIKLCIAKDIDGIFNYIISLYDINKNDFLEKALYKYINDSVYNYNFLGRIIFVTKDLNSLVKKLSIELEGTINQGPQK